jgi:hypothetical protein
VIKIDQSTDPAKVRDGTSSAAHVVVVDFLSSISKRFKGKLETEIKGVRIIL